MKGSLKDYVSEFEGVLNIDLLNKSSDAPLVEYIIDAWKSLEVVDSIKCTDFIYEEKESEIDINKHIYKRDKSKRKKDRYDYKFISDDRCGKLTVKLEITLPEIDPNTGEKYLHTHKMQKSMLIPLQDEEGYYYIKGKKYYMIYQMLEKSTYTSASSLTLKSLMPVAVKRGVVESPEVIRNNITNEKLKQNGMKACDTDGKTYNLPVYYVYMFKKEVPAILFYLSRGIHYTLLFLGVHNVIRFIPDLPENLDPDNIYFQISSKCYIEANRELFNKYPYIQSIVGGFLTVCTNRCTIDQLDEPDVWIRKISVPNNYEKGLGILKFFNRLLDQTTKKIIKIHPYHKDDIYTILRWMMQEFNELRLKDNLDLKNKRLRCNEYIASLMTKEFSKRLNRILSKRDKAMYQHYQELFKFPGDILIQKLHNSGILRFDDSVNDMTFFSKTKYTTKGPHSLGNKNSNNVGIKYRSLHPSFLGYIDILVCGNSDPGTSGVLSPFTDIEGFYFDNSEEPDDFAFKLSKDLERIFKEKGIEYVKFDFESKDDYFNAIMSLNKYVEDNVRVSGTSREGHYEIIVDENVDALDDTNETTENNSEES